MTHRTPAALVLAAAWTLACAAPRPHLPGLHTAGHCGLESVRVHTLGME